MRSRRLGAAAAVGAGPVRWDSEFRLPGLVLMLMVFATYNDILAFGGIVKRAFCDAAASIGNVLKWKNGISRSHVKFARVLQALNWLQASAADGFSPVRGVRATAWEMIRGALRMMVECECGGACEPP